MENFETGKQITSKILLAVLLLSVAGLVVAKVYPYYTSACVRPIEYSIGSFDDRFDIDRPEFILALKEAEKIWETPTNKDLLNFTDDSTLKINLIYDHRQEATDKLKSLGYKIDNTQSSYTSLKTRYASLLAEYDNRKKTLDIKIAKFESRKVIYEQQVQKWNSQGGAPKKE